MKKIKPKGIIVKIIPSACRQKCLHAGRGREISVDFAKMNSSAYVCTLAFIFTKSAQASRISKIGLPVVFIAIN